MARPFVSQASCIPRQASRKFAEARAQTEVQSQTNNGATSKQPQQQTTKVRKFQSLERNTTDDVVFIAYSTTNKTSKKATKNTDTYNILPVERLRLRPRVDGRQHRQQFGSRPTAVFSGCFKNIVCFQKRTQTPSTTDVKFLYFLGGGGGVRRRLSRRQYRQMTESNTTNIIFDTTSNGRTHRQ